MASVSTPLGRPRIARMSDGQPLSKSKSKKPSKTEGVVPPPPASRSQYGQGRRKLLDAAARLVAREGSARLTLRELAQEAGMSHNSIYRHFRSVEDMMPTLIGDFTQALREGLSHARKQVPSNELPSRTVVGWLLDFALARPDAFVVAMRERHGPTGPARQAIEEGMNQIMADMRHELGAAGRLPPLPSDKLDLALRIVIQQTFLLCLLCIEAPERREAILAEAELVFAWCLTGAMVVSGQSK